MSSKPTTQQLSDNEIITDVLGGLKSGIMLYMNGIIESSCPKMRTVLTKLHVQACENQFEAFQWMNENDLYPIENADTSKLKQTINKYSQPLN